MNTLELKKSQFLSKVIAVHSVEEADQALQELRLQHKKATHICYALVLSNPSVEKANDDGEPSGTAGKPILGVMKISGLTNALLVVVRYFGGIKLGAGGLLRAYVKSASFAIQDFKQKESKT